MDVWIAAINGSGATADHRTVFHARAYGCGGWRCAENIHSFHGWRRSMVENNLKPMAFVNMQQQQQQRSREQENLSSWLLPLFFLYFLFI
jgi:hypothetical protein